MIWDWPIFLSQLFGFAVVVHVLVRKVLPPLRSAMSKAQNTIRTQLEDSARAANQVVAAAEAREAAVAQGELAKAQLKAEADAAAAGLLDDMRVEAEESATRIRRRGRVRIHQLRRELVDGLQASLHTAVLDRTEHTVRRRLTVPHARTAGIDRFLDELEQIPERPGVR
ncbi:hypothetical protein ACFVMC_10810 [Nocardia sp. NPDC127579]|uniref:F0F1 ATP synthase subunit B family protein n=1 Tax=Nocardia sp. NPDC127579 TaxID=3345402 RepID=UPI00363C0B33